MQVVSKIVAVVLVGGAAALGMVLDPTVARETVAAPPAAGLPPLDYRMPGADPAASGAEISIGDDLRINGQRVSLRQYISDDPIDVVADYYADAFGASHRNVQRFDLPGATYVGVLADDGRFLSVTLLPQQDGTTMVVPGVSVGAFDPGAEQRNSPLPLHPSYEGLLTYASHDGGKDAIAAQYTTPRPFQEIRSWYGRELRQRGFRIKAGARPPGRDDLEVLRFVRNGQYATVSLQSLDHGAGTLVYLLFESPQVGAD